MMKRKKSLYLMHFHQGILYMKGNLIFMALMVPTMLLFLRRNIGISRKILTYGIPGIKFRSNVVPVLNESVQVFEKPPKQGTGGKQEQ